MISSSPAPANNSMQRTALRAAADAERYSAWKKFRDLIHGPNEEAMSDTWIIDIQHYLTDDGYIALPSGPGRNLAEYFCQIIAMASNFLASDEGEQLIVKCRRRPQRKACQGELVFGFDLESFDIQWNCPVCGDNGVIRNWQGTFWDLSIPRDIH